MELLFHLSQPDNLMEAAKTAERLNHDTLWNADRLLYPVKPRTKYPVSPDGSLPDIYKRVLDPIEALNVCRRLYDSLRSGHQRTRYSVLQSGHLRAPMTTLDILSNGRLRVGFGLGWPVARIVQSSPAHSIKLRETSMTSKTRRQRNLLYDFPRRSNRGFSRGDGTVPQLGVTN